jgi:DNA-binding NarL/FixJ family response regulator
MSGVIQLPGAPTARARRNPGLKPLTARELQILQALADGEDYGDIGEREGRSQQAIKNAMRLALAKLGADNKTQGVAMALRRGLIQ